jgi:4'-phosphopantetheinyl transferase
MSQTMNITDSDFQIEAPLALPADEVHLWRVDLEAVGAEEARWQQVLAPDESTRAARFHFSRDRQCFVTSRALLRMILAGYLATDPKSLRFARSKNGKPSLGPEHADSGITFNVSHSGGIALFAFARRRDVGVDVERVRHDFDLEAIACRFFSAHEQRQLAAFPAEEKIESFFRCWTRKEAYIKATGDGLSLPLSQFDVSLGPGEKDALLETRLDRLTAGRWLLGDVPAGPGYIAALCAQGRDWKLNDWCAPLRPQNQ